MIQLADYYLLPASGVADADADDADADADADAADADNPAIATAIPLLDDRRAWPILRRRTVIALVAAATTAVAVTLLLPPWPKLVSPREPMPEQTVTIHRSARAGDVVMIFSHMLENAQRTQLHMYMVNAGDIPEPIDVALSDSSAPGATTHLPPSLVPPRSTVHRVVEVRAGDGNKSVSMQARESSQGPFQVRVVPLRMHLGRP